MQYSWAPGCSQNAAAVMTDNDNNDSHHHYGFWWKDLMESELKNLDVDKLTVVSSMLKFCLPKVKWPVLIWLSALEWASKVRTAFLSSQSGSHGVCSLSAAGFWGACLGSAVFSCASLLCVSCCTLQINAVNYPTVWLFIKASSSPTSLQMTPECLLKWHISQWWLSAPISQWTEKIIICTYNLTSRP